MKATATTIFIWLFLVFVTGSSLNLYFKEKANSTRLTYNLKAANETAEQFKTKDGHNASKLKAQELTISELRRINPQIISQLKNLYIPPRLTQSYTQISQEFKAEITPMVKDSIIVPARTDTIQDTIKMKMLEYRDKWISIIGKIDPLPAKIKILATDTIFTAIYKGERRRPWLWVLSKRQLTTAATNRSPYIKINVVASGVIKN